MALGNLKLFATALRKFMVWIAPRIKIFISCWFTVTGLTPGYSTGSTKCSSCSILSLMDLPGSFIAMMVMNAERNNEPDIKM